VDVVGKHHVHVLVVLAGEHGIEAADLSGGVVRSRRLHDFTDANGDGANPVAPLVLSSTGVFYGTTSAGGTAGKGTIFAVEGNIPP
jgi:hypothetical protein